MKAWKQDFLAGYDQYDQIILQLCKGDPERIRALRYETTHTGLAEAYMASLMN